MSLSSGDQALSWPRYYRAPAKINRHLEILSRRPDGYHNIHSIMHYLSLWDILAFRPSPGPDSVLVASEAICGPITANLVWRAHEAMRPFAQTFVPLHIELIKHIPAGAGLGGGSSDAATTLIALNELWNCQLSLEQLLPIGARLGADVPFFLYGQSAQVRGIGEILSPSAAPCPRALLLIVPPCICSTPAMYQALGLPLETAMPERSPLPRERNTFEPVARALYPEIEKVFQILSQYGKPQLNGSGSSVFIPLASRAQASAMKRILKEMLSPSFLYVLESIHCSPAYWGVAKW